MKPGKSVKKKKKCLKFNFSLNTMNFMMKKSYTGNVTGPLIMIILLSNAICITKTVLDILAENVFLNCLNVKYF